MNTSQTYQISHNLNDALETILAWPNNFDNQVEIDQIAICLPACLLNRWDDFDEMIKSLEVLTCRAKFMNVNLFGIFRFFLFHLNEILEIEISKSSKKICKDEIISEFIWGLGQNDVFVMYPKLFDDFL